MHIRDRAFNNNTPVPTRSLQLSTTFAHCCAHEIDASRDVTLQSVEMSKCLGKSVRLERVRVRTLTLSTPVICITEALKLVKLYFWRSSSAQNIPATARTS